MTFRFSNRGACGRGGGSPRGKGRKDLLSCLLKVHLEQLTPAAAAGPGLQDVFWSSCWQSSLPFASEEAGTSDGFYRYRKKDKLLGDGPDYLAHVVASRWHRLPLSNL